MSVGASVVNKTANTRSAMISGLIGVSCITNHIATPVKAIIYVGDSEELLKMTAKIKVDAR